MVRYYKQLRPKECSSWPSRGFVIRSLCSEHLFWKISSCATWCTSVLTNTASSSHCHVSWALLAPRSPCSTSTWPLFSSLISPLFMFGVTTMSYLRWFLQVTDFGGCWVAFEGQTYLPEMSFPAEQATSPGPCRDPHTRLYVQWVRVGPVWEQSSFYLFWEPYWTEDKFADQRHYFVFFLSFSLQSGHFAQKLLLSSGC